jgi:nucleolar complex protein 3
MIQSSELCLTTLNTVFRADIDGQVSLEAVRLLNRMIKERRFAVDPAVLSCLLQLRVHKESHVRVSEQRADKHVPDKSKGKGKSKKDKTGTPTHISKKTKKMLKERKEIEGEMQEAAAEIDMEEKATAVCFSTCMGSRSLLTPR